MGEMIETLGIMAETAPGVCTDTPAEIDQQLKAGDEIVAGSGDVWTIRFYP
jgi:hypothetical protein